MDRMNFPLKALGIGQKLIAGVPIPCAHAHANVDLRV